MLFAIKKAIKNGLSFADKPLFLIFLLFVLIEFSQFFKETLLFEIVFSV